MKRDEDFPIEPLPDTAWKRIEQSVFAELDSAQPSERVPPRRRFARPALWALCGAQLAAAAAFLIWKAQPAPQPDAPLASRRVVTFTQATQTQLDGATVRVEAGSALVLVETQGGGAFVAIERGAARFAVPKRKGRPAFVVQAGDVRVEVVGTRFRVERVGSAARVETYEGSVRVAAGGKQTLLQRGERWPLPTAAAPALAPSAAAPGSPTSTRSAAANTPAPQALRGDGRRQRFEQAAGLEATDPQQALRIYRGLSRESGPWAENALYAAGRLELERGRRESARRLLRSYLDRHPAGANAADARSLIDQLSRHEERITP